MTRAKAQSTPLGGATFLVRALVVLLSVSVLVASPLDSWATDWQLEQRLLPEFGHEGENFGASVGIDGGLTVIGAPQAVSGSGPPGAAYIYQLTDDGWTETIRLSASDSQAGDLFGTSVAISDDLAVVGARKGTPFGDDGPGAAYVFQRSPKGSWREVAKLSASDENSEDWFGWSVDIDVNTVISGAWRNDVAAGAAYVFEKTDQGWNETVKLTASDAVAGSKFGDSVAISDDVVIVGASGDSAGVGSSYIFDRTDGVWTESAKLSAFLSGGGDSAGFPVSFGSSVDVFGDYAIVGAYGDDQQALDAGAAYIFERSENGWTSAFKLTASDAAVDDWFGWSVAIGDGHAIVGSRHEEGGAGAAYVFERMDSGWTEVVKLTGSEPGPNQFGYSVDISDYAATIGAWRDDENGSRAGAAYVYSVPEPSTVVLMAMGMFAVLATGRTIRVKKRSLRVF